MFRATWPVALRDDRTVSPYFVYNCSYVLYVYLSKSYCVMCLLLVMSTSHKVHMVSHVSLVGCPANQPAQAASRNCTRRVRSD